MLDELFNHVRPLEHAGPVQRRPPDGTLRERSSRSQVWACSMIAAVCAGRTHVFGPCKGLQEAPCSSSSLTIAVWSRFTAAASGDSFVSS
jgi:hypothetical protein